MSINVSAQVMNFAGLPGVPFKEVLRNLPPRDRIKLRLLSRELKEKFDFFDASVRSLDFQVSCSEILYRYLLYLNCIYGSFFH